MTEAILIWNIVAVAIVGLGYLYRRAQRRDKNGS
jgi:hypothetical protein